MNPPLAPVHVYNLINIDDYTHLFLITSTSVRSQLATSAQYIVIAVVCEHECEKAQHNSEIPKTFRQLQNGRLEGKDNKRFFYISHS